MLTRRIAASACALCLIVPGVAVAKPVDAVRPTGVSHHHNHSVAAHNGTAYGDTKYDLQNTQALTGVTGDTKGDLNVNRGPSVVGDTKNDLPRATTPIAVPAPAAKSAHGDATNGWRIAAVVEAGLLAAFVLGCAVALSPMRLRRRAAGLGV
jgi:hypothetical protein